MVRLHDFARVGAGSCAERSMGRQIVCDHVEAAAERYGYLTSSSAWSRLCLARLIHARRSTRSIRGALWPTLVSSPILNLENRKLTIVFSNIAGASSLGSSLRSLPRCARGSLRQRAITGRKSSIRQTPCPSNIRHRHEQKTNSIHKQYLAQFTYSQLRELLHYVGYVVLFLLLSFRSREFG